MKITIHSKKTWRVNNETINNQITQWNRAPPSKMEDFCFEFY